MLFVGAFSLSSFAGSTKIALMREWGILLNNTSQVDDPEIFAKGKNAVVLEKDVQRAADFYILNGLNETEARAKAEAYMMEYEAMYSKAIQAGFQVTDNEVKSYIEELKKEVEAATNRDEVMAVINQFESEDAYWEYEFEVYRKSLPIQNYVKSLEMSYKENTSSNRSISAEEIEQTWVDEFEAIKQQAVQNERYVK
ncbi:hypothetical protein AALB51_08185 [Lachnospiraceae bacterium 62-26]|jgi:hypothetical protein